MSYSARFALGVAIGRPGQYLVSLALAINDRYPRNYVTAGLLWLALPILNLRNRIIGIKN